MRAYIHGSGGLIASLRRERRIFACSRRWRSVVDTCLVEWGLRMA